MCLRLYVFMHVYVYMYVDVDVCGPGYVYVSVSWHHVSRKNVPPTKSLQRNKLATAT